MSQARDNVQGQLIGMQDRGKAPGEVATARAQQVESSWRLSRKGRDHFCGSEEG